jgi:RNA polymerase sigma-70 factor, ECF subfamily
VNKPATPASTATHVSDRTAPPSGGAAGRGQAASVGHVDDRDLVEAARRGDRDAFKTLFQRYHRRAYALALGVVRNPDDALDVVQDGFIKAHRYLDKFEGTSSFYTWLYRIVMNLAIDHLRKQKRARPVELDERRVEAAGDILDDSLLPRILGGNPARALLDKEIRGRIDRALDALSEPHRAVLVMRELDGMSYEEMATAMACSKGTIMSRLFHARKNMQRQLVDLVDGAAPPSGGADVRGQAPAVDGRRPSEAADAAEVAEPASAPEPGDDLAIAGGRR